MKVLKTYLCNPFTKPFIVKHVDQIAVSFHCQMNLIIPVIHLVFILFSVNFVQHNANLFKVSA